MIKFTYLDDETRPAEPCIFCKKPTTHRAAYQPPGVKLERPLCMQCVQGGITLWKIVQKFRELVE